MLDRSSENRVSGPSCSGGAKDRGATGCSCANAGCSRATDGGGIVRAKPGAVGVDRTEDARAGTDDARDRPKPANRTRLWFAAAYHDQDRTQAASVERLWGSAS